jgi:hypothetical protein
MIADIFDNLDNLRLTPEMMTKHPPKPEGKAKPARRKRLEGRFYQVPADWMDRAYAAVIGKAQLMTALRLYVIWRMRPPASEFIIASNKRLGIPAHVKLRALANLWHAGLIAVEKGGNGQAARVKVIE